jgi:signal transduction histidine kinase
VESGKAAWGVLSGRRACSAGDIFRKADVGLFLKVRDNGLGIAAARIDQLFQPFNRAGREASGIEGTGLGLALVKLLVEQMGGAVEVDSTGLRAATSAEIRSSPSSP